MTSIGTLHSTFANDRKNAEERYLGRVFRVDGIVTYAGESMYSTPAIEVSDRPEGSLKAVFVLPFGRDIGQSFRQLENLRPGQLVTVTGECRMVSDADGVLVFKECAIMNGPRADDL